MKNLFSLCVAIAVLSLVSFSQAPKYPVKFGAETALAKLALEAHGGEKLRTMKSLIVRGSVDVTTSAFNQAIPATFVVIFAKEKYRFEIANPFQPIKQVFDGVNTSTTIRGGMTLPPVNRLGLPVLPKIGETGFVITPLPEAKKKKHGFRMTSPEGFYTDFYLDEKTKQIKGYDSSYDINGRMVTTSVEIDKLRVVDGVLVPERYVQRFDTEQITIYANFKAKEILVNSEVADDVFSMAK
ncbi:MAG: hypothetical protein H0U23_15935 [Blastocatellia bacterium]|nr:hypothetical protein [Blastocatellia bacterium]